MTSYICFQEVKDRVPIEQAVSMLGLDLKEHNGQLRGECPVCGEGGPRAFVVTPKKGKWFCFGCKTGGDQIQLVAHIQGTHPKEAAFFLAGQPEEQKKKAKPAEGFRELDYLQSDHDAVEALGFEHDVAHAVGCGYAPRGLMKGTVALPVRLPDGTLIGYIGLTDIAKVPPNWRL